VDENTLILEPRKDLHSAIEAIKTDSNERAITRDLTAGEPITDSRIVSEAEWNAIRNSVPLVSKT
jgi:hypothetical protein